MVQNQNNVCNRMYLKLQIVELLAKVSKLCIVKMLAKSKLVLKYVMYIVDTM